MRSSRNFWGSGRLWLRSVWRGQRAGAKGISALPKLQQLPPVLQSVERLEGQLEMPIFMGKERKNGAESGEFWRPLRQELAKER